ncbi:MAG: response regulator [Bradymonadales bacterium]|nr:MAG: response regulator [Bradymonadales bacterium]
MAKNSAEVSETHTTGQNTKLTTVMIIDDDAISMGFYEVILEEAGYRVWSAQDGLFALALLKRESVSPDLILVDCVMPEMDGKTFLLKLKSQSPQVFVDSKVVGLTSFDSESTPFKQIKALAFDCREKPFGAQELLKIVSDYVGTEGPSNRVSNRRRVLPFRSPHQESNSL